MLGKKRKRERFPEGDDGRSFADMNVEGMPWYRPPQPTDAKKGDLPDLSPKEYKYFMWGVLKAALLIGAVFVGGYFVFIFFLDKIVFGN